MAGAVGTSMLGSLIVFTVILSLQEIYRGKLASSELFTILGGFTSSLLFLFSLTFIGNFQESSGIKSGWGAGMSLLLHEIKFVHTIKTIGCLLYPILSSTSEV
jgi:hypothetical protein